MSDLEKVTEVARLSKRLNDLTDRLNAQISSAEKQLRDGGVGLELWLPEPFTPVGDTDQWWLGWHKSNDGWGFYVREFDPAEVDPHDITARGPDALLDCGRAIRLAAFPCIEPLADLLGRRLSETLELFSEFQDDLPPVQDGPPPFRRAKAVDGEVPF